MQRGTVGPAHEFPVSRTGRVHAKRFVELLFRRFLPAPARKTCRRDGTFGQAEIAVRVAVAEAVRRLRQTQASQDLALGEAKLLYVVADMARQSAAMGEQVADGDCCRRKLILKSKTGIDVADAAVPRDLAVAHQGRDDRRGQHLGHRGELEDGVDIDGFGLVSLTHAEGAEEDDFIAMDDGHREPGYELLVDDLRYEFLEFRQRGRDLLIAVNRQPNSCDDQLSRNKAKVKRGTQGLIVLATR